MWVDISGPLLHIALVDLAALAASGPAEQATVCLAVGVANWGSDTRCACGDHHQPGRPHDLCAAHPLAHRRRRRPSFSATDEIASHCEPQCRWASKTIRTALSRISSAYFPRRRYSVMAPSSQGSEWWALRDPPGEVHSVGSPAT